jgi:hypothetical protein
MKITRKDGRVSFADSIGICRLDAPAIIGSNGTTVWRQGGRKYRGLEGRKHRWAAPCVMRANGTCFYFWRGNRMREVRA